MRRLNIFMFFVLVSAVGQAQFINNGATITIQPGATLRVETDFVNNSGTVTNNGTLEVQDDFTNTGTFTSDPASTVRFIGSTNSDVTTGSAVLRNVDMSKTDQNITLLDNMTVAGALTFQNDNNKVIIGNFDLTVQNGGSIVSADPNEYVVTSGTGRLIKAVGGNSTVTHEVGDATSYTPLSSVVTGTTYTNATLSARSIMTPTQTKYAESTDYISREWDIQASGISGYMNTMTGTYADADINGTESLIKGSTFHSGDWHFVSSAGDATLNTVTAATDMDNVILSGQNFFGKVNLKAFLAGALASGTTMSTTLNTNGLIPLTTPYSVAPFNAPSVSASSIPANATDWILVEVRDPNSPSTLISQTSAFILNNGMIVNLDGQSLRLKDAVVSGHIALKHRNHLSIRTAAALNLVEPPALKDFSLGTVEAYTDPTISSNANMRQVGNVFAMWNGDINQDGYIRYVDFFNPATFETIESDALQVINFLGSANGEDNSYQKFDVNFDGYTRYVDFFNPATFETIESDALQIVNTLGSALGQFNSHF